jgi:hypothetical protein
MVNLYTISKGSSIGEKRYLHLNQDDITNFWFFLLQSQSFVAKAAFVYIDSC